MPNSGEFVTERSAQCDTCWLRESCETQFDRWGCWGYRPEQRCPEHLDKPLITDPAYPDRPHHLCSECGTYVCVGCGFTLHPQHPFNPLGTRLMDWLTGFCSDCTRHREEARRLRVHDVGMAESEFDYAVGTILDADSDWSLAVSLARLTASKAKLKELRGY